LAAIDHSLMHRHEMLPFESVTVIVIHGGAAQAAKTNERPRPPRSATAKRC